MKYILAIFLGIMITPYIRPKNRILKVLLAVLEYGGF